MASTSRLKQDLSCPICSELFRDPVVLSCSHSFCKVCLENWWNDKPLKTCPICKRKISMDPPLNLALKNLVETFTEERRQTSPAQSVCSLHSENLRLFCEDHQDLVCLVCRDSRTHKDHSFRPIEEVAQELREQLRRDLTPLQDKLKLLAQSRAQLEASAAHITSQARHAQTQIRAQFEKLHLFLREEEESRMKALMEEEEQKTQRMKDMMAAVSRDIEAMSQTITETEEQLRAADTYFLLQYKIAAQMVQQRPLLEEPQMGPGALIDQAKHLGNLGFNIWRSMKSLVQFYPMLLDPNTIGSRLVLSKDLSSVRAGNEQEVPKNPERRKYFHVDGSERFVSGTHSWDVEVGENKLWFVGVGGFVQREEDTEGRGWCIEFIGGEYFSRTPSDGYKLLSVKKKLQRVRMKLDFDTKTVTFTDPDTNLHIETFTESFTEGLRPYLYTEDVDVPLKILPKNITVTE